MNKQIEEMAIILTEGSCSDCSKCDFRDKFNCHPIHEADILYNAGYRRQDEVAKEIFAEIEEVINELGYFDELDFTSLKKKYGVTEE